MRTSGHLDVRTSGRPDVLTSGHLDAWTSGPPDVQTSRRPDVRTSEPPDVHADVATSRRPDVRTSARSDVWTSGRLDLPTSGRPDTKEIKCRHIKDSKTTERSFNCKLMCSYCLEWELHGTPSNKRGQSFVTIGTRAHTFAKLLIFLVITIVLIHRREKNEF